MKKLFLVFLVSLLTISLVFAANGSLGAGATDTGSDNASQTGQETGNGTQTNTETQNQGEDSSLQNQIKVQSGSYMNSAGQQMQIQTGSGNEVKLQVGGVEAKSSMGITSEQSQNKTVLKTQLSNGRNAEIKVMPNTASDKAIERLQLKVCSSENGCQIELKEVGSGDSAKVAYEIQAKKDAKFLALFKTSLPVEAQVDAETGEVIRTKKAWWAFLASE